MGGGLIFYLDSNNSTYTGSTLSATLTTTVNTGTQTTITTNPLSIGTYHIVDFISNIGILPSKVIPPGFWNMNMHCFSSGTGVSYYFSLYSVDSDGTSNAVVISTGTSSSASNIPSTHGQISYDLYIPTTILIDENKRLKIEVYVVIANNNKIFTFEFRNSTISHVVSTFGNVGYTGPTGNTGPIGDTGPTGYTGPAGSSNGSNIILNNQSSNAIITCTSTSNTISGNSTLTWDGYKLAMPGLNSVSIGNSSAGNQSISIGGLTYSSSASVVLGYNSGRNGMFGTYNSIYGVYSGYSITSGGGNLILGGNTAQNLTSGNNNTFIGVSTGTNQTTQSNNTICGYYSNCCDSSGTTYSNCSVLGANIRNGVISGNNQVQLGDSASTVYTYATATRSDIRDKTDIEECKLGLDFINKLEPKQYRWDYREDYIEHIIDPITQELTIITHPKDGSKKRNRFHYGIIGQELKQILDNMNIDFSGYQDHKVNNGTDRITISYHEFIAPMIKAIKELTIKNNQLEKRIITLENK